MDSQWQELIQKKRATREALIPESWRLPAEIANKVSEESTLSAFDLLNQAALLSDREIDITENNTASTITAKIAAGELSSLEVASAFCKRAAIVHQLVNRNSCPRCFGVIAGCRRADMCFFHPDKLPH